MRDPGPFIVRLILFAVGIGIATAVARVEWTSLGLDASASGVGPNAAPLTALYDLAPVLIALATFVSAALGSVSRTLATLLMWAVMAAIVTAPLAIARAVGG